MARYPVEAEILSTRRQTQTSSIMLSLKRNSIRPLRKREEFIAMRTGKRQHSTLFLLQAQARRRQNNQCNHKYMRVGYTVTRKVGNAVERNRVRRRMREAARITLPSGGRAAHDYVLIGKRATLSAKFETLVMELNMALWRIHENNERRKFRNG